MASLVLLEALAHNPWLPAGPHLAAATAQARALATGLSVLIVSGSGLHQQQHAGPRIQEKLLQAAQAPTSTPSPLASDPSDLAALRSQYIANYAIGSVQLGCRAWKPMHMGLDACRHYTTAAVCASQHIPSRRLIAPHQGLIRSNCMPVGITPSSVHAFSSLRSACHSNATTAQLVPLAAAHMQPRALTSTSHCEAAVTPSGVSGLAATQPANEVSAAAATNLNFKLPHVDNPVVVWKRPQDAVGRNSKLLVKYVKNIKPKALVQRIMVRPGINSLPDLLNLYQNKIDAITVAAVLTKITTTLRHTKHEEQAAVQDVARKTLLWLEPYMQFQVRYASVPALSTVLWAWASLPEDLQGVWSPDLAALMFVRACQPHPSGDPAQHKLRGVAPKILAQLAWGAAKLVKPAKVSTDPVLQYAVGAVAHHAGRRINQFSPLGLALLADSMVSLSPSEARSFLESKVAPDAARRIGLITEQQFNTATLVRLLRVCAAVQARHVPLFEKAAAAALPQVAGWKPRHVVQLAEAFSQVGVRHEGLMAAIASNAEQWPVSLQAGLMGARITKACKQLNCKEPKLQARKRQSADQQQQEQQQHRDSQQAGSVTG